jgi:hypothetical protein
MLFISDIIGDLIQNAVKEVEDCPECPCCMEKLDGFTWAKGVEGVMGLCEHWVCLSCYKLLKKKTCPLCRADYKDIDKEWYNETLDIKLTMDLSRARFNEEEEEDWCIDKECKKCEEFYSDWKESNMLEAVEERLNELSQKSISELIVSYGKFEAMYEYADKFGVVVGRKQTEKINGVLCFTKEFEKTLLYMIMTEKLREWL